MFGSLGADGVSIRTVQYNGLRYIYSFDNVEKTLMEKAGYDLREYGVLVTAAENMNQAILSKDESGIYTSGKKVVKLGVFDKTFGGICGKTLSKSTDEVTYFAGTVTNFNNINAFFDVYVAAYSIYTDENGNEYISYMDFGNVNENYKTANLFEVTYDMYADEQSGIRSTYVDEAAVWNTLMLGTKVEEYKNTALVGFDSVTVTLVDDGNGNYLAFLRSDKEIPSEAFDCAENVLSQGGYSCEIIGIVLK